MVVPTQLYHSAQEVPLPQQVIEHDGLFRSL
jgi:hypothetical protein